MIMKGSYQRLTYALIAINVAFQYGDLPHWIPVTSLLLIFWRWMVDLLKWPVPGRKSTFFCVILALMGIGIEFGFQLTYLSSTSLLVLMVAIKTLEIRGYRDLMFVTYLCLLLLVSKLLSGQSFLLTVYLVLDVLAILTLMHLYHSSRELGGPLRRTLKVTGGLLPLVIVMFLFFPRVNFNFFQKQSLFNSSSVGFSGILRPGTMSQQAQSSEIVFRAFFKNNVRLPQDRLYWRGAVLTKSDEMNWDSENLYEIELRKRMQRTQGIQRHQGLKFKDQGSVAHAPLDFIKVMLEKGGGEHLFVLDWPSEVFMSQAVRQADLEQKYGLTFSLKTPTFERETYNFTYSPIAKEVNWPSFQKEKELLITNKSSQVQDLIRQWRRKKVEAKEIVESIRDFMLENHFSYSLSAPQSTTLEDFLFYVRQGYCEHYAGATASLLRLMGIPAHVVVGFQGGTPSLLGDYIIVSDRDAHAWVEYWEETKKNWVRLDPTSWVAPDRLTLGGQNFFERHARESTVGWESAWVANFIGPKGMTWLNQGWLLIDQAEISWVNFLIRYDSNYQKQLFLKWYGTNFSLLKMYLITGFCLFILFSLLWLLGKSRLKKRQDPALIFYRDICQILAKKGIIRQPYEGPLSLAGRVMERWPQHQEQWKLIFHAMIQDRYGRHHLQRQDRILLRRQLREILK